MISKIDINNYLIFRFIELDNLSFLRNPKTKIFNSNDLNLYLTNFFKNKSSLGLLLSGGMDSGLLAKYVPKDTIAFTFKFDNDFANDEYLRAHTYAKDCNLKIIDISINWSSISTLIEQLIKHRKAPISTIEPQLALACKITKENYGLTNIVHGGDADIVFGGLSKILQKNWNKSDFIDFYSFCNPKEILKKDYLDNSYLQYFDKFIKNETIDTKKFIDYVYEIESTIAYNNSETLYQSTFIDPFSDLIFDYDIEIIKQCPKYVIVDLFEQKYGYKPIKKRPMPRPVDYYNELLQKPKSKVFNTNLDLSKLTGQQRWMVYCLDKFLEIYDYE